MDIRSIFKEQEELILENQGLVGHIAKKFDNIGDYYEMFSVGEIGLIKAAVTYDKSKKIKFATYASICIQNEILQFLRKEKKHVVKEISLNSPVIRDGQGNEITIGQIIPSPETYFTEKIEDRETIEQHINIILNLLKPIERYVMLYHISGNKQKYIAQRLNITQGYVSRVYKKAKGKIKKYSNDNIKYKKVFDFHIIKNSYKIRFGVEDFSKFKEAFVELIKKLKEIIDLPRFRIIRREKRITIFIDADLESFWLIAEIIKEIDKYVLY